jgi:ABC-type uncharacterized transport system substrate-binding protein
MKLLFKSTNIFFFFLFFLISNGNAIEISRKVLFLHSYGIDNEWTNSVDKSAREILLKSPAISITTEFLNSNNYNYKNNYLTIKNKLLAKYKNSNFDVILISDDEALDFFLLNRNEIFHNIPAVFCGINRLTPENFSEDDRITGIIQSLSLIDTLTMIKSIHNTNKLFIIGDQRDPSFKTNKFLIEKKLFQVTGQNLDIEFIDSKNLSELIEFLNSCPEIPIILISSLYTKQNDILPKKLSLNILYNKTENPIYTFWFSDLKYGAIGGKVVSGEIQGKLAAQYIIDILSGKSFSELPIISSNEANKFIFNYVSLIKYNIPEKKLPENRQFILKKENKQFCLSQKQLYFIFSITTFIFLIILIIYNKFKLKAS